MEDNNMNEGEEINEFQEGGDDYLNFTKEGIKMIKQEKENKYKMSHKMQELKKKIMNIKIMKSMKKIMIMKKIRIKILKITIRIML